MAKTNGYDPDEVTSYVDRLINLNDDMKSEMGAIAARFRSDRNETLDEAKDKGIPKKLLKALVRQLLAERAAEKIRDDLDSDDQNEFDQLRLALGEDYAATPLGAAALGEAA